MKCKNLLNHILKAFSLDKGRDLVSMTFQFFLQPICAMKLFLEIVCWRLFSPLGKYQSGGLYDVVYDEMRTESPLGDNHLNPYHI